MEKYTLLKKLQCLKAKPHSNCDKNLNCNHLEMDVYPLFGQWLCLIMFHPLECLPSNLSLQ